MKSKNTTTTVIWIAFVLVSAAGLGYGIRQVRWSLAIRKNSSESKHPAKVAVSEPEAEIVQEPEPEPEADAVDIDATVIEEHVWEEPEDQSQPEVLIEPVPEQWRMGQNSGAIQQGFGDWRSAWADLNMTEEEQARLREGWLLAVERWQNMSDDERQVQIERMRADWGRWQYMSDEERQAASQRNRERFEQWRESGQIELPEMS